MLLVVCLFDIRPEWTDQWPDLTKEFTEATRAESGDPYFAWSRDTELPNRYVLVETFREDEVDAHVRSPLVAKISATWAPALARDPYVLRATIPGDTWEVMTNFRSGA